MNRDAFDMSVSPTTNLLNPPPEPDIPIGICTSGLETLNSSATATVTGKTVEEPSISIVPDSFSSEGAAGAATESSSSLPQAANSPILRIAKLRISHLI